MSIVSTLFKIFGGSKSERDIQDIYPLVEKIKSFEENLKEKSHSQLREATNQLRKTIAESLSPIEQKISERETKLDEDDSISVDERENLYNEIDQLKKEIDAKIEETLKEILPEAFAIVKETARRFKENEEIEVDALDYDKDLAVSHDFVSVEGNTATWYNSWIAGGAEVTWDMVHYDVQLIGGVILHEGKIAEMTTGEGKTLVATLPIFLNALAGKGVHVVTVNDYLAKRDAEWMGPIFQFHGLTIDCIDKHEPNSDARRK